MIGKIYKFCFANNKEKESELTMKTGLPCRCSAALMIEVPPLRACRQNTQKARRGDCGA